MDKVEPLKYIYNDPDINRGDVVSKIIKAARAGYFTQREVFYLKYLIRTENAKGTNR